MRAESESTPGQPRRSRDRLDAMLACAALAICAVVVGTLAWTRATTATSAIGYAQSGTLSYGASVSPTSVYGSSRLISGQPVYTSAVTHLHLTYDYHFQANAPSTLSGSEQLIATIDNGQGLTRRIVLQPASSFTGPGFITGADLNLADIANVAQQFDRGASANPNNSSSYNVAVTPAVHIHVKLGGVSVNEAFDAAATFVFNGAALIPTSATTNGSGSATASGSSATASLHHSSTGSVKVPRGRTATMLFGLPVADARLAALIVFIGALVGGLRFGLPLLRDITSGEEQVRIAARYGSTLVTTDFVSPPEHAAVVELTSFDGLMQVARRLECPVLHQTGDLERYAVVDNGTIYQYTTASGRTPANLASEGCKGPAADAAPARRVRLSRNGTS